MQEKIPSNEIEIDESYGAYFNTVQKGLNISPYDCLFRYSLSVTIFEYWDANIPPSYCIDELSDYIFKWEENDKTPFVQRPS